MWFDSWNDLARVLIIGTVSYIMLVLLLRVTGKRTLTQLNAFDFVVTVALGSTLATILLSTDVSWAEGAAALAVLILLQLVVALVSTRWPGFRKTITARPVAVVQHGEMQREALSRSRMSESEVMQAIRSSGYGDLSTIAAVVLETNGKLSVIPETEYGDGSTLEGVRRS